MALVVITLSDSADGGLAVSLISEPAINIGDPGPMATLAQKTAQKMIEAMEMKQDEPSRVLLLND